VTPTVAAAERWPATVAGLLLERLGTNPRLRVCLPTGVTPRPVYDVVARRAAGGGPTFGQAQVFLLDEFGLPAGHPARCDEMLRRDLLARLDPPPARVHRLDPAAPDLGAECARYRALVVEGGLDLVLLGLGRNGHVGLNEPGTPADAPTRRVDLAAATVQAASRYGAVEDPPTWGLTLGLEEILAAREVWLLVTGADKGAVLRRVLTGPVGPAVPASFLRGHANARLLVDDEALPAR
jgi:glucosamine-6-phosphate deaminase